MNAGFDSRYDISRFVSSDARWKPHVHQKISDRSFQELEAKYQKQLQTLSNDPQLQQLMNNKVVAALFLDKIPKTSSVKSDIQLVKKYGFSSSTIDSMQLIHYLQMVKDDPRLTVETRRELEIWIETEREYLDIAIIFDGWRSQSTAMMGILHSGSAASTKVEQVKFSVPEDEIEKLAKALAQQFQSMEENQTFKMLGGYHVHETRLHFTKMADGTFTLYHFNTALDESLDKYTHIPETTLSDANFWVKFIKVKLESTENKNMNELLSSIGTKEELNEDERFAVKSRQSGDSCPGQVAEADLKHALIRAAWIPPDAEIEYKLVKSIMIEKALELEKNRVEPRLYALLQSKEQVKRRYIQWNNLNSQQKLEAVELYVKLIKIFNPKFWVSKTPSIALLRKLDTVLNEELGCADKTEIEQVIRMHNQSAAKDIFPIECLKMYQQIAEVKETVQKPKSQ